MAHFRTHIDKAVKLAGSQAKLADRMGCSQQQISYLLKEATGISVEMAVALEKATEGKIPRTVTRPDIFASAGAR